MARGRNLGRKKRRKDRRMKGQKEELWGNCESSNYITSKVLTNRSTLFSGMHEHFLFSDGTVCFTVCCPEFISSMSKNNGKRWWCLSSTNRSREQILKPVSERPASPSQDISQWHQTRHDHWTKLVLPTTSIVGLYICEQKQSATVENFGKLHSMLYWKFNRMTEKSVSFLTLGRFVSLRLLCMKLSTTLS